MDPYRLLGVSPGCTIEELKRAYRLKARHAHPDLGGDEPAFIEVCEAYKQVMEELARRHGARGSPASHAPDRDARRGPVDHSVAAQRAARRPTRTRERHSRPADPSWSPDLILQDRPVWVGYAGKPPDPNWEPELILGDEPTDDEGPLPPSSSSALDAAPRTRRRPELSNQELILGIVLLLCMIAIALLAFLAIVRQ